MKSLLLEWIVLEREMGNAGGGEEGVSIPDTLIVIIGGFSEGV